MTIQRTKEKVLSNPKVKSVLKINLYEFENLSEAAKEKAREWYREGATDFNWWEFTFEDAGRIGLRIENYDLDDNRATGEFNCIGGAEQCAGLVLAEHGKTCETYKTAKQFLADLKKLNAEIAAVDGDDETNCEFEVWQNKRGLLCDDFLQSLLKDYAKMLKEEYEYLLSNESVDENIRINEYTFTASGNRMQEGSV